MKKFANLAATIGLCLAVTGAGYGAIKGFEHVRANSWEQDIKEAQSAWSGALAREGRELAILRQREERAKKALDELEKRAEAVEVFTGKKPDHLRLELSAMAAQDSITIRAYAGMDDMLAGVAKARAEGRLSSADFINAAEKAIEHKTVIKEGSAPFPTSANPLASREEGFASNDVARFAERAEGQLKDIKEKEDKFRKDFVAAARSFDEKKAEQAKAALLAQVGQKALDEELARVDGEVQSLK